MSKGKAVVAWVKKRWSVVARVAERLIAAPGTQDDMTAWAGWLKWLWKGGWTAIRFFGAFAFVIALVFWFWGWVVGNIEAIAFFGTAALISLACIVSLRRDRRRARSKARMHPPATLAWITEKQALRILERSGWLERYRPEGDLDGLKELALYDWQAGKRVTHGDEIIHELARKALNDMVVQNPQARRNEEYSLQILQWWISEKIAGEVGFTTSGRE